MTQLGGSFRFVQLPVVAQLLADLGCTGRLNIVEGDWRGDLVLVKGHIVDAHLGTDQGRAALESITLGLREADFSFVEDVVTADHEPLLDESERVACMMALRDESAHLASLIPTLSSVPRFSEASSDAQITIKRATLNIIPLIATGQTLETIARERGLARTLRDVAALLENGIISLEEIAPLPRQWAAEIQRARLVK